MKNFTAESKWKTCRK